MNEPLRTLEQFGRRLKRAQRRSVRKQTAALYLRRTAIRRILPNDLEFQPRKIQTVQELNPRRNHFDSHGDVTESHAKPPRRVPGTRREERTQSYRHNFPNLRFQFFNL